MFPSHDPALQKKQARGERRLPVFPRKAQNRGSSAFVVVVNLPYCALLPTPELYRLANIFPLRNPAVSLDPPYIPAATGQSGAHSLVAALLFGSDLDAAVFGCMRL